MKYEKGIAEIIELDNSDVITASGCKNNGHLNKDCTNKTFEHSAIANQFDMEDPSWFGEE